MVDGVDRCLSGIPMVYHNAVLGVPNKDWDSSIREQFVYFKEAKAPFVWYVDEEADPAFKEKLLEHGFQDGGIFRGVVGLLDKSIEAPEVPEGCTLELVEDLATMDEFNELVCATFGIQGESKTLYKKVMWDATESKEHPMFHWLARKDEKAVSAVSTILEGEMVSFWNGAFT